VRPWPSLCVQDGDGEIEQASLELAALQDDPGNVSDDGSTSSRRSREVSHSVWGYGRMVDGLHP
jgi:hypothetical protein